MWTTILEGAAAGFAAGLASRWIQVSRIEEPARRKAQRERYARETLLEIGEWAEGVLRSVQILQRFVAQPNNWTGPGVGSLMYSVTQTGIPVAWENWTLRWSYPLDADSKIAGDLEEALSLARRTYPVMSRPPFNPLLSQYLDELALLLMRLLHESRSRAAR